jgi:uridine phosphorylase
MGSLDVPIVTPQQVLEKRGVTELSYTTETAILCFRGRTASTRLIERFEAIPIREKILYHPQLYHAPQHHLLIVPELTWGGPVTAIVVEELGALGIRTLIGYGAAGSINPTIKPGTMFVAQTAINVDGTSKEYTRDHECHPDPRLLHYYRERYEELGATLLNGLTTDSLYRETPRKIQRWRRLGADFINLEIGPFYVVSKIRTIRAIYVGLITDYVGETWDTGYWNLDNQVDTKIIESIYQMVDYKDREKSSAENSGR